MERYDYTVVEDRPDRYELEQTLDHAGEMGYAVVAVVGSHIIMARKHGGDEER